MFDIVVDRFLSVSIQQRSFQRLSSTPPGKSRNPSLCVGADEEAAGSASIRLDDSEEKGGDDQATVKTAASTTRLVMQDTSTVLHERIPILPVLTFVVLYIFCGAGNLLTKMQCFSVRY